MHLKGLAKLHVLSLDNTKVADAGLELIKVRNLSGGIAAIHSAWRL